MQHNETAVDVGTWTAEAQKKRADAIYANLQEERRLSATLRARIAELQAERDAGKGRHSSGLTWEEAVQLQSEVLAETASALGCPADNEAILMAIDALRNERDAAKASEEEATGCFKEANERAEAAERKAERAVGVLREVEWAGGYYDMQCPRCGSDRREAHSPTCDLAAVIRDAGKINSPEMPDSSTHPAPSPAAEPSRGEDGHG